MGYFLLLAVHLLCAFVFIGTVFFEVLVLGAVRERLPAAMRTRLDRAAADRASALMPWVLLLLYAAGIGLAWHHRGALSHPWASGFATLLTLKIGLAASVFGHFVLAMRLRRRGRLRGGASRWLHRSVFVHVTIIVLLAKAMFHLPL